MKNNILLVCSAIVFMLLSESCQTKSNNQSDSSTLKTYQPINVIMENLRHYVKYDDNIIAFKNASVVDGTGKSIESNQTIIIENGLIKAIGNNFKLNIPEKAKVNDLKGKTIIPGIVGMHNHLHILRFPYVGDIAAKLYLAAGVTTIQTCGAASPEKELLLSQNIAIGNQIGPEIISSAPFITGEGGNPNMIIPKNEQHLRDTIQYWMNQGVKWFKVYRNTKPNDLKTILDEVHKNGGKVRGHLCSITFEEATKMGIDGIEHGLNSSSDFRTNKEWGKCNGGREYIDNLIINSPEVKKLQKLMIEKGVFLTSTLSIYEASIPNRAYADERSIKTMSPYLKEQYEERRKNFENQLEDSTRNKRLKRIMEFEYQYFKMRGLLCSGVDAGRHILPGFGDQRNYKLLMEAGFTSEEAIQIMTNNGAKALERSDIGSIQAGKRADFVILNGNLDREPSIIEKVETVFKNGIGYNPQLILNETLGQFAKE